MSHSLCIDVLGGGLVWEKVESGRASSSSRKSGATINNNIRNPISQAASSSSPITIPADRALSSGGASSNRDSSVLASSHESSNSGIFNLFSSSPKTASLLASPVANTSSAPNNNSSSSSNRVTSPVNVKGRITQAQQQLLHDQFRSAANPQFDLEAIAAMTFKEKQLWFLERMGDLQVPWTDGFVKIEVRSDSFLLYLNFWF